MMEWLLAVVQQLEWHGITANGDLLVSDILQQR